MCPLLYCCLVSFFPGGHVVSCQPGRLAGCFFCNGVVSSNVAKPGELASFHCCQQGLLFSICCLTRLYASLCFCCQSPALASVEEAGYNE